MTEENNMTKQECDAARTFASLGINGQEDRVAAIKSIAEDLWIEIDNIGVNNIGENRPSTEEGPRLKALAKTALEETVMWAIKAVSRS